MAEGSSRHNLSNDKKKYRALSVKLKSGEKGKSLDNIKSNNYSNKNIGDKAKKEIKRFDINHFGEFNI